MNPINHSLQNIQVFVDLVLFCAIAALSFINFVLVRRLCDIRQELEKLTNGLAKITSEHEAAQARVPVPKRETKSISGAGLIPVVRRPQSLLAKTELLVKAVPVPKIVKRLHIAQEGKIIGEIDILTIKKMLQAGQLSLRDYFFENSTQKWSTIDCLPELS